MTTDSEPLYSVFYDVVMRRFDNQLDNNRALDAKVATAYSAAAAILAFYGVILSLVNLPANLLLKWLFFVGIGFSVLVYSFLLWSLYCVYQLKVWTHNPDLETLKKYADDPKNRESDLRFWAAERCLDGMKCNEETINVKGAHLKDALAMLPIEAFLLASVALTTLSGKH